MTKKVLLSVLMSVGIVIGAVGVAYAFFTFNATQQGFRQDGEGQAGRVTMTLEAGTVSGDSQLLPDPGSCAFNPCPGGALTFAITNTSDFPIKVTAISEATIACGPGCNAPVQSSNKNLDGTFSGSNSGTCANDIAFVAPANFNAWPTIGAHSTLQVNGTDENALGAGMLHLVPGTPDGCQGALFVVGLKVTAAEVTGEGTGTGFVP